ncbi:hypothetical protein SO802_014999 [Lithocarpus litseifolius]|uniref:RING-type E3 ubiquitin transferase n=1 Tax=Lithocarpus litseifolius TaxID=425828 RepID=A0AAW2CSJ3_9ROSI
MGQICSNKIFNEPGYSDRIMFQSSRNYSSEFGSLKYEYSKIDMVRKLCPKSEKTKGKLYPNGYSYNMRLDMSVKNSKEEISWGFSSPISVGDQIYGYSSSILSEELANFSYSGLLNISYNIGPTFATRISPFNSTLSRPYEKFQISAEGIYDAEIGSLCMVGYRDFSSDNKTQIIGLDCEILVKLNFRAINIKNEDHINGSIGSTRLKSDPLYFELLDLSSTAFYSDEASIWRMDVEITLVLISSTLSCVFVGLQLFNVKRHPNVLPFISLVMLSILTLGHMILLLLNFEALFLRNPSKNMLIETGGWIETNEVIVRGVGMVDFLLQFHLRQKTWAA